MCEKHRIIGPVILLYGCEITNFINITERMENKKYAYFEKILEWPQEKLHINFCRFILGVNNKTTKIAVLSELGRYPLFLKALKQVWKYKKRCEIMNTDSLLYNAYMESKQRTDHFTWYKFVKYMSTEAGLEEEGFSTDVAFENIRGKYTHFWQTKLFDDNRKGEYGNKLRTYHTFKIVYELEPYLDVVENYEHRKCLSRFRLSNHKLEIELGRHKRKPVNERLCNMCNVIEDETHFLINCSKHDTERIPLFVHMQ